MDFMREMQFGTPENEIKNLSCELDAPERQLHELERRMEKIEAKIYENDVK